MNDLLKLSALVAIYSVCAQGASADPALRIDAGVSQSRLSGGLQDWRETFVAISRPFKDGWATALKVEEQERFGKHDLYSELRIDRTLPHGSFYLAAGGATEADFRPEFGLKVGGAMDLAARADVTRLTLDADASRFASGDIYALKIGLDHLFTAEGLRGGLQAVAVGERGGPALMGFVLRADIPLAPQIHARIAYVEAPETTEGIVTRVQGWTAGVRFDASDTLLFRLDLTREDRGPYDREEVSAGAAYRF
ncbi:MAG: YaiO family outer membrane beta-barrel protein [Hyphomonadaceae bacterium]|jgi:YaiO family outer membrane protein|uniref:YaiO family outer membrane beta-barrel protein n=1 Tax=Dokdonella sp. TaxID=2291710 RepID=UPI001B62E5F8|nr:YaiO family outer membrane beta-barrel protein [Dokdonella sp.]MBK8840751.1 YaiO family outer membrane beta-barrel protein [Hyphomonadaceae bacterium]MBP7608035.1 YaiO family outer membrane beta-barrel protein [Steroidobacteraceae bacterium]MBP9753518.1 YaiO family outer membrane beta-barrel protein [Phenylobacterium sp.]HPN05015.1 YaiO family outer membrane beta-barrel protein [Hyphomonadaceae bacterium]